MLVLSFLYIYRERVQASSMHKELPIIAEWIFGLLI